MKKPITLVSLSDEKDICSLYLESNKNSSPKLARKYGVSTYIILSILKKNNITIRNNSLSQIGLQVKENHPTYSGGNISPDGYRRIYERRIGNIKRTCVGEHVFLMESKLGRRIDPRTEVVHHLDGDKLNNCLDNLQLLTRRAHINLHRNEK